MYLSSIPHQILMQFGLHYDEKYILWLKGLEVIDWMGKLLWHVMEVTSNARHENPFVCYFLAAVT